jgi:hypothetical protein
MSATLKGITIAIGLTLLATVASAQEEPMRGPPSHAASVMMELREVTWRPSALEEASADPNKAFSRALLGPGLGHFYCGEPTRGALLLGGAAGSLLVGFLLSGDGEYNPDKHEYNRDRKPLVYGGGGAGVLYLASLFDSRASCKRTNGRR